MQEKEGEVLKAAKAIFGSSSDGEGRQMVVEPDC